MGNSPDHQKPDPHAHALASAATSHPAAPKHIDSKPKPADDWWPESADGQCSESAALFAASQPAPLSVV